VTVDTIDTKIKAIEEQIAKYEVKVKALDEQEEGVKVMFHKIQGAKEALMALKSEAQAELDKLNGATETKTKETVKK